MEVSIYHSEGARSLKVYVEIKMQHLIKHDLNMLQFKDGRVENNL